MSFGKFQLNLIEVPEVGDNCPSILIGVGRGLPEVETNFREWGPAKFAFWMLNLEGLLDVNLILMTIF